MPAPIFRFDAVNHEYIELGTSYVFPHITGMLERTGWIDDTWFTEESSERGRAVHRLTADYDLGALDVGSCVSRYRNYVLAHVKCCQIIQPEILAVEEPMVHPVCLYGGRPDRVVRVRRVLGVTEIKSGAVVKSHQVQTALQAILVAHAHGLEPEMVQRLCLYVKASGKFTLEEHRNRKDFDEAQRIIRVCCGS